MPHRAWALAPGHPAFGKIRNGQQSWIATTDAPEGYDPRVFGTHGRIGQELPAAIIGVVRNAKNRRPSLDDVLGGQRCGIRRLLKWPVVHGGSAGR